MEITLRAPAQPPPPAARPPLVGLRLEEVAGLHDDLAACHREFAPLFRREEQQHWALKYLEGPLFPKEGKEELVLDHFEVRRWRGWHHHTTMTPLAQGFLTRLRSRPGGRPRR